LRLNPVLRLLLIRARISLSTRLNL
jgi:hypothetical protein